MKERVKYIRCTECPPDFTYIQLVNGCYKVVTSKLEWSVAGLECRSLHKDAHLLIINDAQEQSAVARMLASTNRQFLIFVFFCLLSRLHYRYFTHSDGFNLFVSSYHNTLM